MGTLLKVSLILLLLSLIGAIYWFAIKWIVGKDYKNNYVDRNECPHGFHIEICPFCNHQEIV